MQNIWVRFWWNKDYLVEFLIHIWLFKCCIHSYTATECIYHKCLNISWYQTISGHIILQNLVGNQNELIFVLQTTLFKMADETLWELCQIMLLLISNIIITGISHINIKKSHKRFSLPEYHRESFYGQSCVFLEAIVPWRWLATIIKQHGHAAEYWDVVLVNKEMFDQSRTGILTHCGPVMPYGNINLGQYWLRQWLVSWWHKATTWTNGGLPPMGFRGTQLRPISHKLPQISIYKMGLKIILLKLLPHLPGANKMMHCSMDNMVDILQVTFATAFPGQSRYWLRSLSI